MFEGILKVFCGDERKERSEKNLLSPGVDLVSILTM